MERLSGLRALNKRLRLALKGKLTLGKRPHQTRPTWLNTTINGTSSKNRMVLIICDRDSSCLDLTLLGGPKSGGRQSLRRHGLASHRTGSPSPTQSWATTPPG